MGKTYTIKKSYLKFIPYSDFILWDVKRYVISGIKSKYNIVPLSKLIEERREKIKLYDYPEKEFGILGVNNKTGLFDAYKEIGCNINQSYKKVYIDDLAYNPYRINVGSIGWKTELHKHDFISPAYVVFSCNEKLSAEFLYKVFKTYTFNKIINDNTTGSVRQNLKFDTLSNIKIPLPLLEEQNCIVKTYNKRIQLAEQQEQQSNQIEQDIESYLFDVLGIEKMEEKKSKQGLQLIRYTKLSKWALSHFFKKDLFNIEGGKYKTLLLKNIITFFEGGKTPSKNRSDFWNGEISWTSPKDFNGIFIKKSQDHITKLAIQEAGMKVFPKGIFLSVFRSGILRHSFPTAITRIKTTINQDLKAYAVNDDIINKYYFLYFIHTFKDIVLKRASKKSVTVESINTEDFMEIPIPIPPLKIQTEIASTIEKMKAKMKTLQQQADENRKLAIEEFEKEIFQ